MHKRKENKVLDTLVQCLEENPIIAAVRGEAEMETVVQSPIKTVFVLGSDILGLKEEVAYLLKNNKIVFVHVDLIDGIGKDAAGVKYLAREIKPHGIISTRHYLLRQGSEEGLLTIQRMFLVDSSSFQSGIKLIHSSQPDFVEVMPGLVPKAIKSLGNEIRQPIIAGGMITTKEDIIHALQAGALAVSTSNARLWFE